MRKILLLGILFIYSLGYCQDRSETQYTSRAINYIQEKWDYISFSDTLSGKIIHHLPAMFFCGTAATASMTIVELSNGELMRVLDLCNLSNHYKLDQSIKFTYRQKPPFAVVLPFKFEKKGNSKIPESASKDYDLKVRTTTYANIY